MARNVLTRNTVLSANVEYNELLMITFFLLEMLGGAIAEIPKPKRIHVILSKVMGGTMVFWVLWRLKHDWHELVVSYLCMHLPVWY